MAAASRPVCPRGEHRGWNHPLPLDTIPARYGGGWSCPGILPDGTDCGYELPARGTELTAAGVPLALPPGPGQVRGLYDAAVAVLDGADGALGRLRAAVAAFGDGPPGSQEAG